MNYLGVIFCAIEFGKVKVFLGATYYFVLWVLPLMLVIISATNLVGYAKNVEAKFAPKKE
jgi:hypothetical protein